VATRGPFSSGFVGRLHLDVAHVYFFVHEEHGSPPALLSPVLRIGGFVDSDRFHFSAMVLDPLLAALVDDCHEVALAAVLVGLVRPVIVSPLVENYSNQSVLSGRL